MIKKITLIIILYFFNLNFNILLSDNKIDIRRRLWSCTKRRGIPCQTSPGWYMCSSRGPIRCRAGCCKCKKKENFKHCFFQGATDPKKCYRCP